MTKLFKYFHWLIILYAVYNAYTYFEEATTKLTEAEGGVSSKMAELSRLKKSKKEIANFYKDIEEAKSRIDRVVIEIEKTQQLLPSVFSDAENINTLKEMAQDLNIKEMSITPDKDTEHGFYISRKYSVKAKATYLQYIILCEKISENKRILNILDLSFKKLEKMQKSKFQQLDAEFTLEAYRYNTNFKEDKGIDKIENDFKDGAIPQPANNEPVKNAEGAVVK